MLKDTVFLASSLLLLSIAGCFPMAYLSQQDLVSLTTSSSISSCNFNANGSLVITAWSYAVQVWRRTASGNYSLFQAIPLSTSAYFGDFNPDASRLVVGGFRYIDVYLFNTTSGMYEWQQKLSTESFIGNSITEIVFASDGSRMMASCLDYSIIVWKLDVPTQTFIYYQKLTGHTLAVYSISTRGGDILVTASQDATVKVWQYSNLTENYTLDQTILTGSPVSEVDLSPDQTVIASSQSQRTVVLWKRQSGSPVFTLQQTLSGHTAIVYVSKFSLDQSLIASVSADQTLRLWKLQADGTYALSEYTVGSFIYVNFGPSNILLANQAVFWNPDRATLFNRVVDCTKIDNTNKAASVLNQCVCNSPFVWDSSKGCQIDCTKITNALSNPVDMVTCACDTDYAWYGGSTPYCLKKPPTTLIASVVSAVAALLIIGFVVLRYYRYRAQQIHMQESELNEYQMSNEQCKTVPMSSPDEPCSVCLEMSTDVVSSCRHVFHKTCLVEWLKKMTSCPNCRSSQFTVMMCCKTCSGYMQPRAFCASGCRHRNMLACLQRSAFDNCIECRYNQE